MKLHLNPEEIKTLTPYILNNMAKAEKVSKENDWEAEVYYIGKVKRENGKTARYYIIGEKRKFGKDVDATYKADDKIYYAGLFADDKAKEIRCVYMCFTELYWKGCLPGVLEHNKKLLNKLKENKELEKQF